MRVGGFRKHAVDGVLLAAFALLYLAIAVALVGSGVSAGTTRIPRALLAIGLALAFAPARDWAARMLNSTFRRTPYDLAGIAKRFLVAAEQATDAATLIALFRKSLISVIGRCEVDFLSNDGHLCSRTCDEPSFPDCVGSCDPAVRPCKAGVRAPVAAGQTLYGCARLGPYPGGRHFEPRDFALFASISSYLGRAIMALRLAEEIAGHDVQREDLEHDLSIAQRIQASLLPADIALEDQEISFAMLPAQAVGGDFVEGVVLPSGDLYFAVGDVTGHGVTPGLIAMMAQSAFSALAHNVPEAYPRAMVCEMNRVLYRNIRNRLDGDDFLTLLVGHLEKNGCLEVAGAHLEPLIWRAQTGRIERIATGGAWLGILPEIEGMIVSSSTLLGPDDVLLAYTDGLIEARSSQGDLFGTERLEAALAKHSGSCASELRDRILETVTGFCTVLPDDLSLLVIKRIATADPEHQDRYRGSTISSPRPHQRQVVGGNQIGMEDR